MPLSEAARWTLLIWIAFLGGCIGSFMNVVVYRVPRGKNLSKPGSHCPKCEHPIRWWHNIPVFGWILLRGKCYDCKAPISKRYPIVEALFALLFFAVAIQGPLAIDSLQIDSPSISSDLWWIAGYRLLFLSILIALTLIEWETAKDATANYPWKLWAFASCLGFFGSIASRALQPISLDLGSIFATLTRDHLGWFIDWQLGLLLSLVGFLVAVPLGYVLFRYVRLRDQSKKSIWQGAAPLFLIGVFLGYQAVIISALFAMVAMFLRRVLDSKRTALSDTTLASSAILMVAIAWMLVR